MSELLKNNLHSSLIPTKVASEISGYNADYLARLCREKKVEGTQVGRSWLIDRASLETFVREQEVRKQVRAEELRAARGKEYRRAQKPVMMDVFSIKARTMRQALQSFHLTPSTPTHSPRLAALAVALAVVAGSAYASTNPKILSALNIIPDAAVQMAFNAQPLLERSSSFRITDAATTSNVAALPRVPSTHDASRAVALIAPTTGMAALDSVHALTHDARVPVSKTDEARIAQERIAFVSDVAHHPIQSFVEAYVLSGESIYDIGTGIGDTYLSGLNTAGNASLALAGTLRDGVVRVPQISNALLDGYAHAIYAWNDATPKIAGTAVLAVYDTGNALGTHAMSAPSLARRTKDQVAQRAANAVLAVVPVTVSAPTPAQAPAAATVAVNTESPLSSRLSGIYASATHAEGTLISLPVKAENTMLGMAGYAASVMDGSEVASASAPALQASVISFLPATWQQTLSNFFHSTSVLARSLLGSTVHMLAGLFPGGNVLSPTLTVLHVGPTETLALPIPAGSLTRPIGLAYGNASGGSQTVIRNVVNNYYPQALIGGVFSDAVLAVVRPFVRDSIDAQVASNRGGNGGSSGGGGGTTSSGVSSDGATLTNVTISSGTAALSTLTAGSTTLATTTVNGNLSVSGTISGGSLAVSSLSSNGAIAAAFFTATDTAATSTFTNLSANALTFGGSTFTSLLGNGLANVAGTLRVSTTSFSGANSNFNADFLDGLDSTYFLANAFSTSSANIWLTSKSTDALAEGTSSLYFTDARARSALSVSGVGLAYSTTTGALSVASGFSIPLTASTTDWNTAYLSHISSATYPLQISSSILSLAFGTSTSNTWGGTQTFTSAPVLGSLTGFLKATAGVLSTSLIDLSTDVSSTLQVSHGGTGSTSLTGLLKGNGTGVIQTALAGIDYAPATTGSALLYGNGAGGFNNASVSSPLTFTGGALGIQVANTSQNGYLSSVDWNTFNSKQAALTFTYPLVNTTNTISLAFGTSTSNTWGGTQTFTSAPILTSLSGLLQGNGSSAISAVTGTTGQFPYYNGTNTLAATSTIFLSAAQNIGINNTSPAFALDVGGFINTSQYGGYRIDGGLLAYASSTNQVTLFGLDAGGGSATTSDSYQALTAIGYQTLHSNTGGYENTAVGTGSLYANTTGFFNSAVGTYTLYSNTSGDSNAAVGDLALYSNTTGYENTAIGVQALNHNVTGTDNTGLGFRALYNGAYATSSVGVGSRAGYGISGYSNQGSVSIGYQSGFRYLSGSDYNTVIGYQAGYNISTGANNILLGANPTSGNANLTTGSNNIAIGYDISLPSATASNQLNIGNLIFGTGINGTGTALSSGSVGIGTTSPLAKLDVFGSIVSSGSAGQVKLSANAYTKPAIYGLTAGGAVENLLINPDGGNVGIGNTAPNALLAVGVVGSYPWSSTAEFANSLHIFDASSSSFGLRLGFTSNVPYLQGYRETVGVTNLALQPSGGNVGIGTTTPTAQLAITTGSTEALRLSAITSGRGIFADNGATAGIFSFTRQDAVAAGTLSISAFGGIGFTGNSVTYNNAVASAYQMYLSPAGNLGIGTTSPATNLSISGTGLDTGKGVVQEYITGSGGETGLRISNSGTGGANYNLLVTNTSSSFFGGTGGMFAIVDSVNGTGFSINSSGNVGIGTIAQTNKLSVNGNASVGTSYRNIVAPTNGLIVQGSVGIGSSNPFSQLDVRVTSPGNTNQPNGINGTTGDNHTALFLNYSDGTSAQIGSKIGLAIGGYQGYGIGGLYGVMTSVSANTLGDLTFDLRNNATDTLFTERMRITSTGNVGIGTTSPATTLAVTGNGYITNGLGVGIVETSGGVITASGRISALGGDLRSGAPGINASIRLAGTNNWDFYHDDTIDTTALRRNSIPMLTVLSNNYVGIGTTTPTGILTVYEQNDYTQAPWIINGVDNANTFLYIGRKSTTGRGGSLSYTDNSGGTGYLALTNYGDNIGTGLVVKTGGNVGIGTTTPTSLLSVASSGSLLGNFDTTSGAGGYVGFSTNGIPRGYIGTGNSLTVGAAASDFSIRSGGGNIFFSDNGGTARMTLANTGSLGIATAPVSDYLLSLAGTTANNNSRIIDITQANNSNEDSAAINIVNTANLGTLSGSLNRSVWNSSSTLTPTATVTFNASGATTLNVLDHESTIDLSNVSIQNSGSSLGQNENFNAFGVKSTITGTPSINKTSGSRTDNLVITGLYSQVSPNLTVTALSSANANLTTYGGYLSNSSVSPGNSALNAFAYGAYINNSSVLTTTGNTTNYGAYITAPGVAVTNYGLYLDNVTAGSSNNNYGLYLNNIAASSTNYAIYSSGTAQSYLAGNLGIGTTTPSENLTVNGAIQWGNTTTLTGSTNTFTSGRLGGYTSGTSPLASYNFIQPGTGRAFVVWNAASNIVAAFGQTGSDSNTNSYFGGNVGVGTTSPLGSLEVTNSNATNAVRIVEDGTYNSEGSLGIRVLNKSLTTSLNIGVDSTNNFSFIQAMQPNVSFSSRALVLQGAGGSVGIATTTPTEFLTIQGSSSKRAGIALYDSTLAYSSVIQTNSVGLSLLAQSAGQPITLFTSAGEVFRATSGGNVGIGTTTPWGQLSVNPSGITGPAFVIGSSTATKFLVTNGGNLGIGTTSPTRKVGIVTTGNGPGIEISDTTFGGAITLSNTASNSGSGRNWVVATAYDTVGDFAIRSSNAEGGDAYNTGTTRFTIKSNGNLQFEAYGAGTLTTDASGNVTASSDERLKNINGSFTRGLADLQKLSPILYHWNVQSGLDQASQYAGFSAQNVQGAIPEAVFSDPRGYLSLQDRPILAASVNAIKELAGRTDSLSIATTSLSTQLIKLSTAFSASQASTTMPHALTATSVTADSIAIAQGVSAGTLTAQSANVDGTVSAARYVVPQVASVFSFGSSTISMVLPAEALTTGGVDIYKLAGYASAGVDALAARTDLLAVKLDDLATRVAALEMMHAATTTNSTTDATASGDTLGGAAGLALTTIQDALKSIGIIIHQGYLALDSLVTHQFFLVKGSDGTSSTGSVVIPVGATNLTVTNPLVHPSSKIFLTFTSSVNGSWYISKKLDGSFTITLSQPQTADTEFDYFLIQTDPNAQVASVGAAPPAGSTEAPPAPAPVSVDGGPVVTLNGDAAVQLPQGASWTDPGAKATAADGTDVTSSITLTGTVDTNTAGLYTITYHATDAAGKVGQASRVVTVLSPTTAPSGGSTVTQAPPAAPADSGSSVPAGGTTAAGTVGTTVSAAPDASPAS